MRENIKFGGNLGKLRLRGKSSKGTALSDAYNGYEYSEIRFTTKNSPVDCTGDIRTLIDYEDYANANTTDARFCKLFNLNEELRTAPSLPAKDLVEYCYCNMFSHCSSLTTTPALPATTLVRYCYDNMFANCSSLTTVTSLPAYELAEYCYHYMFTGCKSLTNLPELPEFSSLATGCFYHMFQDCTKLSSVRLVIDDPEMDESFPELYFLNWLNGAGTKADSPQLYLVGAIGSCYGYLCDIESDYLNNEHYFPENWTVLY